MTVYARVYDWRTAPALEFHRLVDHMVSHPEYMTYPHSEEEMRAFFGYVLTDPSNLVWTTYSGRDLTGAVFLTRIVPRVDAQLHFSFIDKDLSSKRQLLRNLIGFFFRDLGFNRLSMEVPEGVRLERFARKVLDFRLEGEIRPRNPELPKGLTDNWVARQGSRREQAYFDGQAWKDIVLLRLLACEWTGGEEEAGCPGTQSQQHSPSSEVSLADSLEVADPRTPSPPSPKTSSPSDNRT